MINNFTDVIFSGVILNEDEARDTMQSLTGSVPDELKSDDAKSPWAVWFADRKPITLSVGENEFTIIVRGAAYKRGDVWYPGMDVTARYYVDSKPGCPGHS